MLLEKPIFSVHGGFSSSLMKITGCFKAGNGHSASPRGFPAFQHPVIFIRELENPPFTEKIRFLTPFLENYTNKILFSIFYHLKKLENVELNKKSEHSSSVLFQERWKFFTLRNVDNIYYVHTSLKLEERCNITTQVQVLKTSWISEESLILFDRSCKQKNTE